MSARNKAFDQTALMPKLVSCFDIGKDSNNINNRYESENDWALSF